jgi:two-component sensor histidine kinase
MDFRIASPPSSEKALVPITEQSSEAALSFARSLINASQLPLLLFDGEARVVLASRSFHGDFDIPPDGASGRTLAEIAGGGWDIPHLSSILDNALANGAPAGDFETDLVRKDMRLRRLQVNLRTVVHGQPRDTRVLMAITDVTRVRDSERLNISLLLEKDGLLRERAILLDEMQHRIANSLQIIASILLLKARAVKSEETREHLRDAHDRVMSLAAVQQHLQSSLGDVQVGPYLTKLCESLAGSMIRDGRVLALRVAADPAVVTSREAVSLGLVVTELVINALKHAFPLGRDGVIDVAYRLDPEGWTLSVRDNGVGMLSDAPAASAGLGTSIIQGLAKQLGAGVSNADAMPGLIVALRMVRPPRAVEQV